MEKVIYSDLALSFTPNPNTGDITPVKNERAVKLALQNLIGTEIGSRPYYPEYGSNIKQYLFEQSGVFSEADLIDDIKDTIEKFEPRVILTAIEVNIEDFGIEVIVEYYVRGFNNQSLQIVNTLVRRD